MLRTDYRAIIVAALAAFVATSVWYIAFGDVMAQLSPALAGHLEEAASWRQPVVVVQGLVLAIVLARMVRVSEVTDWMGAVWLALWLWVGLVGVQCMSAMMWEDTPWKLAAIHAGDWLVKLLLITVVLGTWPARGPVSPSRRPASSP